MNLALQKGISGTDGASRAEGGMQAYNAYKDAIFVKKKNKVDKLKIENASKKYKKYLIKKQFQEDLNGQGMRQKKIPK